MFADREGEPFTDVHLITCKSKFLEQIGNPKTHQELIESLQSNPTTTVCEYVDFRSSVPTICINASYIDEVSTLTAVSMISEALKKVSDKVTSKLTYIPMSAPIAFTADELSILVNRH
jgi:hypothetical protein